MNPGSLSVRACADFRGWIEGPSVYVAGLNAQNCAFTQWRQFVCPHSSLIVRFDARQALLTKPRKAQGLENRSMNFVAHHDLNGRGSKHSVIGNVPPSAGKQGMTCSCQRRKI